MCRISRDEPSTKIIYLGFEKSQRSVMHDSLRYMNFLTYLLTYLQQLAKINTCSVLTCYHIGYSARNLGLYLMNTKFILSDIYLQTLWLYTNAVIIIIIMYHDAVVAVVLYGTRTL